MTRALPFLVLLARSACSRPDPYGSSSYMEAPERPKTAAELRAELLDQERGAPAEYFKVEANYWRNLIDQLVIEGDIANQATLANFKDPMLQVVRYSKTNTEST